MFDKKRLTVSNCWRVLYFLVPLLLVSCSFGGKTSIRNLVLTTSIDEQNRPQNSISAVSFDAPIVYLTGEVVKANAATQVMVRFRKQDGSILATYTLVGERTKSNPYDFVGQVGYKNPNFFAVSLARPAEGWPEGNFIAEAWLDGQLAGQVVFKATSAQEAEKTNLEANIKAVSLGDTLNEAGKVVNNRKLSRLSEHFYLTVVYTGLSSSLLSSRWTYLNREQELAKFDTVVKGDGDYMFDLPLGSFKKSFVGGSWPLGVYRVDILLDNIVVRTVDFTVG